MRRNRTYRTHTTYKSHVPATAAVPPAAVDSTSLAVFRIVFGCAVAADMVRYLVRGNVDQIWVEPHYYFTYFPFDGLEPLPGPLMHALFWLLAALGVLIAIGLLTHEPLPQPQRTILNSMTAKASR